MRATNRLTNKTIKSVKAGKHNDGQGLWLIKREDGGGQWVLRISIHGKRREMGLGSISNISLKDARLAAGKWRQVLSDGKDPIKERERIKREATRRKPTLAAITEEAFEARKAQLKNDGKAGRWESPLRIHILPKLGKTPIEEID